jgi:hypothetical protein
MCTLLLTSGACYQQHHLTSAADNHSRLIYNKACHAQSFRRYAVPGSYYVLCGAPAGVNIFLSRPFVVGDQVKFAGGSDLEGTVEAVEIMRTLLRTTGEAMHAA